LGRKTNLSGISPEKRSQSGPNSVYVDMSRGDNIQEILGAIGPFWANWDRDESRGTRIFFCVVNHASFRQLRNGRFSPNLVTKRSSVSRRGIRKDIFENFHFMGHLPQNLKSKVGHLTQSRLQVTGCTSERYCLLRVVVQWPGSFLDRSTFVKVKGKGAYSSS